MTGHVWNRCGSHFVLIYNLLTRFSTSSLNKSLTISHRQQICSKLLWKHVGENLVIAYKWKYNLLDRVKHCGTSRNCSIWAISSITTMCSKSFFCVCVLYMWERFKNKIAQYEHYFTFCHNDKSAADTVYMYVCMLQKVK